MDSLSPEKVAGLRDLSNRLRGRYAVGPIMANGEPEFGYRVFETMPDGKPFPMIHGEAADAVDALLDEVERLRGLVTEISEHPRLVLGSTLRRKISRALHGDQADD